MNRKYGPRFDIAAVLGFTIFSVMSLAGIGAGLSGPELLRRVFIGTFIAVVWGAGVGGICEYIGEHFRCDNREPSSPQEIKVDEEDPESNFDPLQMEEIHPNDADIVNQKPEEAAEILRSLRQKE